MSSRGSVTVGSTKVKLRSKGIGEMLKSKAVRRGLTPLAQRTAAIARADAPVDSGEYQRSIVIESDTTDRAVERVVSTAPHGLLVEMHTGNLARALGKAGG